MIIGLFQIYLLACGDLTAQALLAELRQRSISEGMIRNDRKVWLKRNVWGGETGLLWSSSFLRIIGPFLLVQQVHSRHQLKSAHWAPRVSLISFTTTLNHHLSPPSLRTYKITQVGWEEWIYTERCFFCTAASASSCACVFFTVEVSLRSLWFTAKRPYHGEASIHSRFH